MQSDYERSTTTMTLGTLPAAVREALRERAGADLLTLADDAPAFLTHSRKVKKSGLLARLSRSADPDTEHLTALVLGERDVLVCTHGEKRATAVLAARLEDVDTRSLGEQFGLEDDGVSVNGFPVSSDGTTGRGSFYFGLGAPDGDAAKAALEDAIRRAKA